VKVYQKILKNEWGEKRGSNPRQPESQSLRNYVACIQLKLEGVDSYYLSIWVTPGLLNPRLIIMFLNWLIGGTGLDMNCTKLKTPGEAQLDL